MYQSILLAYDGSHQGARALREGAEIARRCSAKVHLLAVIQNPTGPGAGEGFDTSGMVAEALDHYKGILELGLQKLRETYQVEAEGHLLEGDPVERIAGLATEVGAQLIVVGHQPLGLLSRWWRGSVGKALIDNAPCSVLVAISQAGETE
ncbi:MAG: universal stress protein [Gammaproteobacteria bacterium]|jgi:nucleotide-binding universal stress UspA family protein